MILKKAIKSEEFQEFEKVYNKRIKEFLKSKSKDFKDLKENIKRDFEKKSFEFNSNFGECTIGGRFLKIATEDSYKALINYCLSEDISVGKEFCYDFIKKHRFVIRKDLINRLRKYIEFKRKNLKKESIERKFFDLLLELS